MIANWKKLVPWVACGLALAGAATMLVPRSSVRGFELERFGRLPVLEGGRVKPIDSLARNSLLVIRGAQEFRFEDRTVQADEWLLDVMFRPEVANTQPVFQIDDPEVLGLLQMPQTSQRRFPFTAIQPYVGEIERQAQLAQGIDAQLRTRFQSAVLNLYERIYLYFRLQNSIQIAGSPGLLIEIASAGAPGASVRQAAPAQLAHFRPLLPPPGATPDACAAAAASGARK